MTLLTENEARQKWCPKARVMEYDQAGAGDMPFAATVNRVWKWLGKDRGGEITWESCHCIASDCMAWRWLDPDGWAGKSEDQRKGYCGAFGRPE